MHYDTRVSRWGNSLAVRIPQAVAKEARLTDGDRMSLNVAADGTIVAVWQAQREDGGRDIRYARFTRDWLITK